MTEAELLQVPWYAVVNDTVGGFSLSNVDKPTSALDYRQGEVEIAWGVDTRAIAQHIADLHNAFLETEQIKRWHATATKRLFEGLGLSEHLTALVSSDDMPLPQVDNLPHRCSTPGCDGDERYAAPGRGHIDGCRHPLQVDRKNDE